MPVEVVFAAEDFQDEFVCGFDWGQFDLALLEGAFVDYLEQLVYAGIGGECTRLRASGRRLPSMGS